MNKLTLYFAGPLFSQSEKEFNYALTKRLEKELGLKVFLPQRDGYEFAKLKLSQQEKTAKIFELDKEQVFNSDVFLFVLDGRAPDEGGAVELGMAHAHKVLTDKNRLAVGLLTDVRSWFIDQRVNPLLVGALDHIAVSEDGLMSYLKEHITSEPG